MANENNFWENNIKTEIYTVKNKTSYLYFSADYFFGGYRNGDFRLEATGIKNLFKEKNKSKFSLNLRYTDKNRIIST